MDVHFSASPISHVIFPLGLFTQTCSDAAPSDLDDDDLALLVRFVNPSYLSEDSWPKIQAKFEEDGSVQLQVQILISRASQWPQLKQCFDFVLHDSCRVTFPQVIVNTILVSNTSED